MLALSPSVLGQPSGRAATFEGLLWIGAIVLAFLLIVVVLHHVHKKMDASGKSGRADFTLQELRRLRDDGRLTEAEYEVLKRTTLDGYGKFPG